MQTKREKIEKQIEDAKGLIKRLEIEYGAADGPTPAKESRLTGIELPGGHVLHLTESAKDAAQDAAQAEHEAAIAVFESLGMSKDGAVAAAKGRTTYGSF